ncbi:unnamed protein product [Adineta ricciae]|nr:unnamed protein product [Adineta ricciae]
MTYDERETLTSGRNCAECKKKPPQVQCLHCSQFVCLECAQKHVNLVALESEDAMHFLNEKLDILDQIAAIARQKIVQERDMIVRYADEERDRSFMQLARMIDVEKQKVRYKSQELNGLPLNAIPAYIRELKAELQYLTIENNDLINVSSTAPRILLQQRGSQRKSIYDDDDNMFN